MPILRIKNLKLREVTQAACLVPKEATGPLSWEFPNSLSPPIHSGGPIPSFSEWEYKVVSGGILDGGG